MAPPESSLSPAVYEIPEPSEVGSSVVGAIVGVPVGAAVGTPKKSQVHTVQAVRVPVAPATKHGQIVPYASATPVTPGVPVPHMDVAVEERPELLPISSGSSAPAFASVFCRIVT